MKTCSKCGEIKAFSEFYKNKLAKDGFYTSCKYCESKRKKELKQNDELKLKKIIHSSIIIENKILLSSDKRLCKCCKLPFNIIDMSMGVICYPCKRSNEKKHRNTEKGALQKKMQDSRYYKKNKETYSAKAKEYREKNKELISIKKRDWYDKNIEKKK